MSDLNSFYLFGLGILLATQPKPEQSEIEEVIDSMELQMMGIKL